MKKNKRQKKSKKYELTFTRKVAVPFDEDIFELANLVIEAKNFSSL